MTTTKSESKATALAQVQALIAGTNKHFPNGSFTLGNTVYTTASLVQALKVLEEAITRVNALQASTKDAVSAMHAAETQVAPLLRDYRSVVRAAFSTTAAQLADFGLEPPKARKPLDSEKRALAAAKMRATRKARGTTSKKQKLAVKGDVTGVLVTPITTAPAATPSVPPAPSASSAPTPGASK